MAKKGTQPKWQMTAYPKLNMGSLFLWCLAAELAVWSGIFMMQDVFPDLQVKGTDFFWLELILLATILVYEAAIPAFAGKFGNVSGVAVCFALPVATVLFFWNHFYHNMEDMVKGFLFVGNVYLEKFNVYYKMYISLPAGEREMGSPTLCFVMALLLFLFLSLSAVSRKRGWILLFPLLFLSADLLVGFAPGWKGISLLFLGVLFCNMDSRVAGLVGRRQKKREKEALKELAAKGIFVFVAVLLVVLAPVLLAARADGLAAKGDRYRAFQKDLEKKIESFSWDRLLADRQMLSNRSPVYADKPVVEIVADQFPDHDLYLREFYGTTYQKGIWYQEGSRFETACRKAGFDVKEAKTYLAGNLYELANEMRDHMWKTNADAEGNALPMWWCHVGEPLHYELNYKMNVGRSALFPYLVRISGDSYSLEGDCLVKKKLFSGKTEVDSFCYFGDLIDVFCVNETSVLWAQDSISPEKKPFFDWYDGYAAACEKGCEDVPAANDIALEICLEMMQKYPNFSVSYGSNPGNSLEGWTLQIGKNEYLSNQDRYLLAWEVSSWLQHNGLYDLRLDSDTGGLDVAEYFLSESRHGYCMHFATAGALILQEMGVPARYASGYVVKCNRFQKLDDGKYHVTVLDNCAHAWIEIYLDGIGWIPMEMTPGYKGDNVQLLPSEIAGGSASNQWDNSDQNGQEESGQEESPTGAEQDPESENPEESENSETSQSQQENTAGDDAQKPSESGEENPAGAGEYSADRGQFGEWCKAFLKGLFAVNMPVRLVLVLALLAQKLIRDKRRRLFFRIQRDMRRENYSRAVWRMNRYLYRRMKLLGKLPEKRPADSEYLKVLKENFPKQTLLQWETFGNLAKKATYSGGLVTKEEAKAAAEIFFATCEGPQPQEGQERGENSK